MELKIHYSSTKNKLKKILKEEKIVLPPKLFWRLLEFLSKMYNYEEEEIKIKPCLLLGYNLYEAVKYVPYTSFFPITKGKKDGSDLEKKMKALVPFCNNGWTVFINIKGNCIEYGIVRAFTGSKGLTLSEIIFEEDEERLLEADYGLIEVCSVSKYEISVKGLRKNYLVIDSRFFDYNLVMCNYTQLSEDLTSGIIDAQERQYLLEIFCKFMPLAAKRMHGTILLIVDSQYEFEDYLKDGLWLENPIDLYNSAIASEDDAHSAQVFYGISGLFIDMMNVDGITVVDNKCKILGFNIFINKGIEANKIINGGARKRAAWSVQNINNPHHLGVYFLSQDGEATYERKY